MAEIVPRWEWRAFGGDFGPAEDRFAALEADRIQESDEVYLLSRLVDENVKVRDDLLDVKELERVNRDGLEQWTPVLKASFPIPAAELEGVLAKLRADMPALTRKEYTLDQLLDELVRPSGDLLGVRVHKRRQRYTIGGCMTELTSLRTDVGDTRTVAVESEDPELVQATRRELGLDAVPNVSFPRGLKALAGFGGSRFAVIDAGTNSVKFHVGEHAADGTWRTVVDRADVTRLGEGLDESGKLGAEPIARTIDAIAGMVEEARNLGVEEIAAVGTAGLRIASNSAELIDAVRERCGLEIEVISGEEESRLAYLAAESGLGVAPGLTRRLRHGWRQHAVHLRQGGRRRRAVQRQRRRRPPDGALRSGRAVSEETLAEALDAIAAELAALDGRPPPDAVVGMGGAVTNMAAVKHGLAKYDPEVVQGTELDRAEIERQIELYRTRDAGRAGRSSASSRPGRK